MLLCLFVRQCYALSCCCVSLYVNAMRCPSFLFVGTEVQSVRFRASAVRCLLVAFLCTSVPYVFQLKG